MNTEHNSGQRIKVVLFERFLHQLGMDDREYTYDSNITDLKLGNIVLVPVGKANQERHATVVSLVSDFAGDCKKVIAKVAECCRRRIKSVAIEKHPLTDHLLEVMVSFDDELTVPIDIPRELRHMPNEFVGKYPEEFLQRRQNEIREHLDKTLEALVDWPRNSSAEENERGRFLILLALHELRLNFEDVMEAHTADSEDGFVELSGISITPPDEKELVELIIRLGGDDPLG